MYIWLPKTTFIWTTHKRKYQGRQQGELGGFLLAMGVILIVIPGLIITSETASQPQPSWKFWKKRRYVLAIWGFTGFINVYTMRVNLSVAIVAMTKGHENEKPEFEWSNEQQGHILSAFFYGYMCTQFPAGIFAAKYGGKLLFGLGVSLSAVLTVLTPVIVKLNVHLFIAVRVMEGLFQGVTYPCIHALWSRWAPPFERARLATLAFSGCFVGTVITFPLCSYIAHFMGWPWIFYITGGLSLIWWVGWVFLIAGSPAEDKWISAEEREYIEDSLKYAPTAVTSLKQLPWKSILTSMPVWAIIVSHTAENWGFYTLLVELPKFLSGILSALPYLLMSILIQFSGQFADWFLVKGILSVTAVRKLFNCGAFIGQTIFMLIPAFIHGEILSIFCLTMSIGLGAFAWSGFAVNHLDIAPAYASILMGFGQIFATMPGFISPTIAGFIVHDNPTMAQWQVVFLIAGAIYLFGAVFYGIFASGKLQPWAAKKEVDSAETV